MKAWRSLSTGRRRAVIALTGLVLLLVGLGFATLSSHGGRAHQTAAAPVTTSPSGILSRVNGVTGVADGSTGAAAGATSTSVTARSTPSVKAATLPVEVHAGDSGKTFNIAVGDDLVVTLDATPPGPWSAPTSTAAAVVSMTAEVSNGTVTAIFRAAAAGAAQVTAHSTAPVQMFTITVKVS